MPRISAIRGEVQRLLHAAPFRPFVLTLENGEHAKIGHPENIAFDPSLAEGVDGWDEFYVISSKLRIFSTFGAVTSIALLDQGQLAG